MSHTTPSHLQTLEESARLLATLESYSATSPAMRATLDQHRALHARLEAHHTASEAALASWREALTRRWQCEIEGQRLFMTIVGQLRASYGANSPYLRVIDPGTAAHAGGPADLLNDLRRLHASLKLIPPPLPFDPARLDHLEAVCCDLDAALAETCAREAERRHANLERRMAQDAFQRTLATTQNRLSEWLKEPAAIGPLAYGYA